MSDTAERATALRRAAAWFELPERGLLRVQGADRVRWADGMLSNDVAGLSAGEGCYALLLTPQGRIVADLHVLCWPDELWLELARDALEGVRERLEKFVIADDVTLVDASDEWRRFACEGARAAELLARLAGAPLEPAPDGAVEFALADARAVAAAWGVSGEPAFQLFVPAAAADAARAALAAAAEALGIERGDEEVLEVLRIEAGTPRLGAELDADVLPSEALLIGRAVSLSKGCYTGQEIVARMESRDARSQQLVAFHFEGDALPSVGAVVECGGRRVGELTSACHSSAGPIGLGYVRRAQAEAGTAVEIGGIGARIAALPRVVDSELSR